MEVYEKRPDPTVASGPAGRSVNLALTKRAIRTFEAIGAKERILEHAIAMFGRTSHGLSTTHFHQYGKSTDCNYSISRHLLNNLLIQAAKEEPGVKILFEQKIISFDLNNTSINLEEDGTKVIKSF